jgi:HAD-superfamily phosphatase, subfamily IIIC/FkbH-like domain
MRSEILKILERFVEIGLGDAHELRDNMKLMDLGLDSLQFVRFMVEVEAKYGFEITDRDLLISNFETIGTLLATLEKYINGKHLIKKVLICDCDDCLWHGVAGEEAIHMDISSIKIQDELINLYSRGILICLCSNNEPENIRNAMQTVEMPLKENYILISKINGNNKADNIREIAAELGLSLDSFVFIDNSDYEIGLMNLFLPEVTSIRINYAENVDTLITKLEVLFGETTENINRTQQYREQKLREKDKSFYITVEEYNESLDTMCTCEQATLEQAGRIAELSQRTNQFNLANARYSADEITDLILDSTYLVFSLTAKDKYGDMGMIGAAIVRNDAENVIEAFWLSCRVFGRKFEHILLNAIKENTNEGLKGVYSETVKNKRFMHFYPENGVGIYVH